MKSSRIVCDVLCFIAVTVPSMCVGVIFSVKCIAVYFEGSVVVYTTSAYQYHLRIVSYVCVYKVELFRSPV